METIPILPDPSSAFSPLTMSWLSQLPVQFLLCLRSYRVLPFFGDTSLNILKGFWGDGGDPLMVNVPLLTKIGILLSMTSLLPTGRA